MRDTFAPNASPVGSTIQAPPRSVVAWDAETCRFRPGRMAPELVCVSYATRGQAPGLVSHMDAEPLLRGWLSSGALLVGHNVAYDFGVICAEFPHLIPLVFAAYREDRITDTKLRAQLLDIAAGCYRGQADKHGVFRKWGYSLDDCIWRIRGTRLEKDTWRKVYGQFRGVPIAQWPEGARKYAIDDGIATLEVHDAQEPHAARFLKDQYRQARAAWWLHLTSTWGLRTNPEALRALLEETEKEYEEKKARLVVIGLVRADGSRDTKAAQARMIEVCVEQGIEPRKTKGGGICLDGDACEYSGDPVLDDYAEYSTLSKVLSTDIPALLEGAGRVPLHTQYGMAETGRTTSGAFKSESGKKLFGMNTQNPRRKAGIRECFVPRPGKVFAQADFDQIELRTLSQACIKLLGYSTLGKAINAGLDPHTAMAASILRIPYENAAKRKKDKEDKEFDNARQTAKVANFGFPGGLGPARLVYFAKKTYDVVLTERDARALKRQWLEQWPEMREYFALISAMQEPRRIEQLFTGRIRSGCTYTAACNTYFQGLAADCAKEAGWLVAEACYVDRSSPLFGSRIVVFAHDELILETDDNDNAHDAAHELARLMMAGANKYLPDVPAYTEPTLMRVWSKGAKAVHDARGRLVPWVPAEAA